jgi:hypothetical protein
MAARSPDAQLNGPVGVAVTADGGFLIAGTFNQVARQNGST